MTALEQSLAVSPRRGRGPARRTLQLTDACATTDTASQLSLPERERLGELEGIIERGMGTFMLVGAALAVIRDHRLYRASHPTFEAYVRDRWDMVASRARQLIAGAAVAIILKSVTTVTPVSERQLRPLLKLEEGQRVAAWERAVKRATEQGADQPTAKVVEAVVREIAGAEAAASPEPPPEPTAQARAKAVGLLRATEAINALSRIPKDDPFRSRGLQMVADWTKHNQEREETPPIVNLGDAIRALKAVMPELPNKAQSIVRAIIGNLGHIKKALESGQDV